MLLQFCDLGVTMSWDDGSWERGRPARTKPGTAWAISPTWINRERRHGSPSAWPMGFSPTGWLPAASHRSSAAAKGTSMRAGRPRSQGNHSPLEGESQKPSRQAKADAVGGGGRATSQKTDLHPLGNSRLPASRAPAPGPGGSFESETTDDCGLSRARTLSGEVGWRQNILFILSIHANQGSTHARRRDQTPGTSFCDLGVTSCPFLDFFFWPSGITLYEGNQLQLQPAE